MDINAHSGKRLAAVWVTIAGLGIFTSIDFYKNFKQSSRTKKNSLLTGCSCNANKAYLAAVLPYLLRNRSTRPPIVSTDFCVPV
jgi:hypothetical protein